MNGLPRVEITYPAWVREMPPPGTVFESDDDRMGLAIELSRQNVLHETGGPFGAAVFERDTGRLVAVGVNRVVPLSNSTLHGEMVAFMMAQCRIGSYSLGGLDAPAHELFTSCEPCAMCLGATLWSGVTRLVSGATRDDALRLRFDEGPVFAESYAYLASRGVECVHGVLRAEATGVLELYRGRAGAIYNA